MKLYTVIFVFDIYCSTIHIENMKLLLSYFIITISPLRLSKLNRCQKFRHAQLVYRTISEYCCALYNWCVLVHCEIGTYRCVLYYWCVLVCIDVLLVRIGVYCTISVYRRILYYWCVVYGSRMCI